MASEGGTFVPAAGGTFETVLGGTIKLLPSYYAGWTEACYVKSNTPLGKCSIKWNGKTQNVVRVRENDVK